MKMENGNGVAGQWAAIEAFIVEDIFGASDEDILAEAIEDGIDPAAKAAELRAKALSTLREAKRGRLAMEREAYEKDKSSPPPSKARPPIEEIKSLVQRLISSGAPNGLSLAFRKGQKLSDSDWEGLWDDMIEKGLIDDGSPGD